MFGLTGWKTIASGLAAILSGAGMVVSGVVSCFDPEAGGCNYELITSGWQTMVGGLAIIGIGHKVQKVGTGTGS